MRALVRGAVPEDADAILPHLVPKQRSALNMLPGGDLASLKYALAMSEETFCAIKEGVPVCLGGVVRGGTALAPVGIIWMTITPELAKHPKQLLRDSRAVVHGWCERFPVLIDYIDTTQTQTLRWLRWLGFDILDPVPGMDDNMVHPVELRAWA